MTLYFAMTFEIKLVGKYTNRNLLWACFITLITVYPINILSADKVNLAFVLVLLNF